MSHRTDTQLQAVIGRALIDPDFRARLVADVRGTLRAEGFSLDEATLDRLYEAWSRAAIASSSRSGHAPRTARPACSSPTRTR
jgi:hypothetical protein